MKRFTITIIVCILIFALSISTALAVDNSRTYSFQLTSNGSSTAAIGVGDMITVKFTLAADNSYALYAMQNEIKYDSRYLQYVDGSLSMTSGFNSGFRDMEDGINKLVLMNYVSDTAEGETINSSVVVGTFQLKAIANGTSTVSNEDYYCTTKTGANNYTATASDLIVNIKSSGGGGGGSSVTYYTINASAGEGGSISPSGSVSVAQDGSQTFTINPNYRYIIEDVQVDGKSVGDVSTYAFSAVTANHTIKATFIAGEEEPNLTDQFTDLVPGAWYINGINYVLQAGLFNGTSATRFSPDANMTRSMLVTVLWRLDGTPDATVDTIFNDVADGLWYSDAIEWAAANNIVNGYGNGRFGTNDSITREQMAVILYNYAKIKGYDVSQTTSLSKYTDTGDISDWASTAMAWANATGLVNGRTATTLAPGGTATRAEVATILMRFIEYYV